MMFILGNLLVLIGMIVVATLTRNNVSHKGIRSIVGMALILAGMHMVRYDNLAKIETNVDELLTSVDELRKHEYALGVLDRTLGKVYIRFDSTLVDGYEIVQIKQP